MGRRHFFGQLQDVLVFAADDAVTPHFGGIRGREAYRDGVVVHVQSNEQDGTFEGRWRSGFGTGRAN